MKNEGKKQWENGVSVTWSTSSGLVDSVFLNESKERVEISSGNQNGAKLVYVSIRPGEKVSVSLDEATFTEILKITQEPH